MIRTVARAEGLALKMQRRYRWSGMPCGKHILAILVALAPAGCGKHLPAGEPAPLIDTLETRVFLIGDAGGATPGDPVLRALRSEIAHDPRRSLVVFLGDNVYPAGLPAEGQPGHGSAAAHLRAQVDAVRETGTRGVFVPGNHDWGGIDGGPDGLERIRRQAAFIAETGGAEVEMAPTGGCPGPFVRDIETSLRIIFLDSHWWLHPHEKPRDPDSDCPADSEAEVLSTLDHAIRSAGGRTVVVAAHHPLASGGEHGGYFSWTDHLFPLRAKRSWLWIPLPVIGSAYPIARQRGVSSQDFGGALNRRYREAIEGVFQGASPLLFAAGHEHNLQVLEGKDVRWLVVSGAGYFGHTTRVVASPATRFAREASGFMRLDVAGDGAARLAVLTVDAQGRAHEAWSGRLEHKEKVQ
jgi:hypothetical protein